MIAVCMMRMTSWRRITTATTMLYKGYLWWYDSTARIVQHASLPAGIDWGASSSSFCILLAVPTVKYTWFPALPLVRPKLVCDSRMLYWRLLGRRRSAIYAKHCILRSNSLSSSFVSDFNIHYWVPKIGRLSGLVCLEKPPFLDTSKQFWLEIEIVNFRSS